MAPDGVRRELVNQAIREARWFIEEAGRHGKAGRRWRATDKWHHHNHRKQRLL
jgi:hypothetical protein